MPFAAEYKIINADALDGLKKIQSGTFDTCITSPPYFGLRDYGITGQIGLEKTPEEYIQRLVDVFREVRRVLKEDGTLWVNIGDSYAGSNKGRCANGQHSAGKKQSTNFGSIMGKLQKTTVANCKPKDLIGIPWILALALREDGWYLRQDIIWNKTNAMPESVRDRCAKSHEYLFLLSKSRNYYFDCDSIKVLSKSPQMESQQRVNKRSVWDIATSCTKDAHFATFPAELVRPCILAGSRKGGTVIDPFSGSGTTIYTAMQEGRNAVGIELNPEYVLLSKKVIEGKTSQMTLL